MTSKRCKLTAGGKDEGLGQKMDSKILVLPHDIRFQFFIRSVYYVPVPVLPAKVGKEVRCQRL